MNKKVLKEIFSWVMVFVVAFALAFTINKVVYFKVVVPSASMETTIMTGDKVIAFPLAYKLSKPKRGDIIVFPFPDDEEVDYIKRVMGLPGETIEGKDGLVYIEGVPLNEPYVKETLNSDFGPYTVPKDSYFMMGDNRNDSADSRFWTNTFVKKDKIKGKAIFKYPKFTWLN